MTGLVLAGVPARLPVDVPVQIGREAARGLARDELSGPVYRAAEPSLLQRGVRWVLERFTDLLERAAAASPGGWFGIVLLVAVVALVLLVLRRRLRPTARSGAGDGLFGAQGTRTAAEHRAAADAADAAGEHSTAVLERFRAVVRALEERGLLDPAPGRTAYEAAGAAAGLLPDLATPLHQGAGLFDAVRYGTRRASAEDAAAVRALDAAVGSTRPSRAAVAVPAP